MAHSKKLLLLVFLAAGIHTVRADSTDTARARMRVTVLQLRSVTAERDSLQAQNTDLQNQVRDLTEQFAKVTKQGAADRDAASRSIAELQARAATQAQSIADYQKSQSAAQAELRRTTALLSAFQSRAASLTGDNITLKQSVDQEKARNAAMLKLATEVLGRYQKQGIGDLLLTKEPFTGLARTRLENIAQDYQAQLVAQRIKP